MTVRLFADPTHKAVVFSYSFGRSYLKKEALTDSSTVEITATNSVTGDVGSRVTFNTGTFVLFYPMDFTGTDEIVVTDDEGYECRGTVTIPL